MTPVTGAWERHVHAEQVWGTVVTFDLRGPRVDGQRAHAACRAAVEELHRIDRWLSPFRADSAVTAMRAGRLDAADAPEPVREVIDGCQRVHDLTGGAFDPWAVPAGFDPCGYVKGWGADRAAAILMDNGFPNVSVNAAGDVTCRGSAGPELAGWRIAIADSRDRQHVLHTVLVENGHLATSGRYEQGDHVVDPRTGRPARTIVSASVLAHEGGLADAMATALVVQGAPGLAAVSRAGLWGMVVTDEHLWSTVAAPAA